MFEIAEQRETRWGSCMTLAGKLQALPLWLMSSTMHVTGPIGDRFALPYRVCAFLKNRRGCYWNTFKIIMIRIFSINWPIQWFRGILPCWSHMYEWNSMTDLQIFLGLERYAHFGIHWIQKQPQLNSSHWGLVWNMNRSLSRSLYPVVYNPRVQSALRPAVLGSNPPTALNKTFFYRKCTELLLPTFLSIPLSENMIRTLNLNHLVQILLMKTSPRSRRKKV